FVADDQVLELGCEHASCGQHCDELRMVHDGNEIPG
ncbi:hypothetical protein CEXT_313571, partial [Caerostris extrusa]